MPLLSARAAIFASAVGLPPATPTLATATRYWIAKDNATYYDSANNRLRDQIGTGHLQLGATTGAEGSDPTFATSRGYRCLQFDGSSDFLVSSGLTFSPAGEFTIVVVAERTGAGNPAALWSSRSGSVAGNGGIDLLWRTDGDFIGVNTRVSNGSSISEAAGANRGLVWATGAINAIGSKRNSSGQISTNIDGGTAYVTGTLAGTLTQSSGPYVGCRAGTALFMAMNVHAIAVWNGTSSIDVAAAKSEALSLAAV